MGLIWSQNSCDPAFNPPIPHAPKHQVPKSLNPPFPQSPHISCLKFQYKNRRGTLSKTKVENKRIISHNYSFLYSLLIVLDVIFS